MHVSEYSHWYYLIYLIPGATALLLLFLSGMGLGGRHHARLGGHGHHLFGSRGAGHTHGHSSATRQSAIPNNDAPLPQPAPANDHANPVVRIEGAIAPKSPDHPAAEAPALFLVGGCLLGWSICGFLATEFLTGARHNPDRFAVLSMVIAAIGAILFSKLIGAAAVRLLPKDDSLVTETVELCGQTGTVVYPVDSHGGRVYVYDRYGTLHDVRARTAPGKPTLGRGKSILVADYDASDDHLVVEEI